MTINLTDLKGLIESVAAGIAVGAPMYLLFFRQLVSGKNATIENLRERITTLEGERLSVVIEEKRVLEKDIKARAEQQKESDRLIEEMEAGIAKLAQSIEKRSLTTEQLVEKIVEVSVQVQKLIEVMAENRILDQTVGLIPGVQKLQEAYVEWRLLFIKLPSHEGTIEFDKYLYHQFKVLQQLLDRVREGGKPIKIDELTANPELSDKIAEIAKSNYPPALVDSVKKPPLGSGG